MSNLSRRLEQHHMLSQHLPGLSQAQVIACLKNSETTEGWGVNHSAQFKETPVFVKRIPLTTQEYARAFDTANHFDLPMYYHYGVGSAGFGAFRELLTHIKCSQWVTQGLHAGFPLLYHYRILPTPLAWKQRSEADLKKHLAFWNHNENIAHYLAERAKAPYEIMLFLEYFPYTLHTIGQEKPLQIPEFIAQADHSLQFLQQQGILHLDAHLANILSDGNQVYISDFGLALDRQFNLQAEEMDFFEQHTHYDRAELLSCLNGLWLQRCQNLTPEQQKQLYQHLGVSEDARLAEKIEAFFAQLHRARPHPDVEALLGVELNRFWLRHQNTLLHMAHFFEALRQNPRKDTPWANLALPKLSP